MVAVPVDAGDTKRVYSPCLDARVERSDGFSYGIAFASKDNFFYNSSVQLSPCDSRLSLSSSNSQISVFRPKVDEISLLTINSSSFSPDSYGYMVAFAGRNYAARSPPAVVANSTYIVTSFTLVLEFKKAGCKIYIGKEMGVLNAQEIPTLSVPSIRIVVEDIQLQEPWRNCRLQYWYTISFRWDG